MSRRDLSLGLLLAGGNAARAPSAHGARRIVAIDSHAHVFTRALPLAGDRRYAPGYDAAGADYLAMLDRNGMSHGVLVQPSFLGADNAYLIEILQQAPERLRGIAVIAPETGSDELEALRRVGVVGIRLNLIGQPDPDFGAAGWNGHLEQIAAQGWQVEVQAEARRLPTLLPPLLRAGVPLVVDHFGRPDPRLGVDDPGFRYLLETAATGRVWVKLSGAYRIGGQGGKHAALVAAERLRIAFGPGRLLWGSDWPHTQFEAATSPAAARQALEAWVPDEAERRTILADTPARLFRFNG
jgi:predicted TIM-barrel fold metal-dependent hydrolase